MTDLNPEIWNNPTLGRAANNLRLDVLEKQEKENRHAKLEGRKPRTVYAENDYPMYEVEKNRPSRATVIHFTDEQEHEVPNPGGTPHKDRDYKTHPDAKQTDETSSPTEEKSKAGSSSEKTTKK